MFNDFLINYAHMNESFILLIRLLIAALLGGLIGFERDLHGRAAGLRTNLLVCVGAALFMIISELAAGMRITIVSNSAPEHDPTRIAAQVVTGIGFLGAGAIIKEGINVRGLTTAASLWIVAAIGLASGAGMFFIAGGATVISLFVLVFFNYLEKKYHKDSYRTLTIVSENHVDISKIIQTVKRKDVAIVYCDYKRDYENNYMTVKLSLRLFHKGVTDKVSHKIVNDLEKSNISLRSVNWFH